MPRRVLSLLACLIFIPCAFADVLVQFDFESGWDSWSADNGVWQVGSSCNQAPYPEPHGGSMFAGTVLCARYPAETDSRLISPTIALPTLSPGEEVRVRFWQWFSYGGCDSGQPQVRSRPSGGAWSAWVSLPGPSASVSQAWSLGGGDLTPYAGKEIQIGFFHQAQGGYLCETDGEGWYLDDVWI